MEDPPLNRDGAHDPGPGVTPRRRRSRSLAVAQGLAIGLVVALFGLLVWKVAYGGEGAELVSAVKRGERPEAPAFSLPIIWNRPQAWPGRVRPALVDGRVDLAELRGTPLVLNFWASWCIPCKEEAPFLAAAAQAHRREVAFLGVDIQDFERDAREFLDELEVPYSSVRDGTSNTPDAYGLTGVPETYYLDAEGRIVEHATGAVSRRELEAGIVQILPGAL
jgi:cytochrome c biogenesis protein CcmG, thiol:disulfide interchange protein DsbE